MRQAKHSSNLNYNSSSDNSPELVMLFTRRSGRLWMFCMSAACHAALNRVVMGRASVVGEFRFFLSNYLICLLETVFNWWFPRSLQTGLWKRLLGYLWVTMVIVSLTPTWQYPLIRAAVGT